MSSNGYKIQCGIVKWQCGFFRSAIVAGHCLTAVCLPLAKHTEAVQLCKEEMNPCSRSLRGPIDR